MKINGKEFKRHVIDHGNDIEPLVALLVDSGAAPYNDETRTITFLDDETGEATTADPARMEE